MGLFTCQLDRPDLFLGSSGDQCDIEEPRSDRDNGPGDVLLLCQGDGDGSFSDRDH